MCSIDGLCGMRTLLSVGLAPVKSVCLAIESRQYERAMRITLNGESREIAEGTSVRGLLDDLNLGNGPVAVERNAVIVPRAEHANAIIHENDTLEVVQFVGGG